MIPVLHPLTPQHPKETIDDFIRMVNDAMMKFEADPTSVANYVVLGIRARQAVDYLPPEQLAMVQQRYEVLAEKYRKLQGEEQG